ncbi:MAG: Ig-like domain repeat protein, partial [Terriglobales bacterium]
GSPNPSTYATSVTFTATITSDTGNVKGGAKKNGVKPLVLGGTVTWSANTGCSPSTVTGGYPGVATCTTSSATKLPVGADTVTATYSGDSNHNGSTGTMTQNVTGGIATTMNASVNPTNEDFAADSPATITAVLSWTGNGVAPTASDVTISGNGNGTYGATSCAARVHETITCTATYTPTNADLAGPYTETATFSGDTNYSSSTGSATFTINPATSSTAVTSGLNPSTYGGSVTFTATVEGENGAVKGQAKRKSRKPLQVTGGSVGWNVSCDSSTPLNPSTGVATCTTAALAGGTDTVTATYSGDVNHSGSSGSVSQVVNAASQTITCGALPGSEAYNSSFTASCSASSSLPVTYASSGSCSNVGATYTMTSGSGSCLVTVTQGGNNNYLAAPPFNGSVNATPASQVINVTTPAPPSAYKGWSFTIVASASSGLPITYSSAGVCTNVGATYTITAATGTCTEKMNAPSSANYYAAPQVLETTTVAKAVVPTVSLTGGPTKAPYESTFTVTATSNETGPEASVPAITTLTPTVCSVSGYTPSGTSASATVTMLTGAGTCTVEATWAANYVYAAALKKEPTTAQKVTPTVTFTGAPATEANGSNFTVTATSDESGSGAVAPTITTPGTVCTVGAVTSIGSGSYQATVTMVKATGTCTLNAKWATSSDYMAASAAQHTTATH